MIICDTHEFAFVHIPKCAGTTVRRDLRPIDTTGCAFFDIADHPAMGRVHLAHLTLADIAAHYPDAFEKVGRYRSMAIVRNPVERFESAIQQRLREFKRVPQSSISGPIIAAETADVIAYLDRAPARLDLEHVHFTRQSEFIEFDGARFVDEIFSLDDMAAVARHVTKLTGVMIGREPRNRTTELRFRALRPMQRLLRGHYAQLVGSDQRRWIRDKMTRAGFYKSVPKTQFERPDGPTARFIHDYYARDLEIVADVSRIATARAA